MESKQFQRAIKTLQGWAVGGWRPVMDRSVKSLAAKYRGMMKSGKSPQGQMQPVKEITMNSPIRWGGPDKRIRKNVNSSPNKPIQATGKTINSIKADNSGDVWEISSKDDKGNMILEVNASRYGRDPLVVGDKEFKFVADQLLNDIIRKIL